MLISKAVQPQSPDRLEPFFTVGEGISTDDIGVTISRDDKMLGQVSMDWSHWPLLANYGFDKPWRDIFERLAERGRRIREERALARKSDERFERWPFLSCRCAPGIPHAQLPKSQFTFRARYPYSLLRDYRIG
jgi:hypothetical protein